MEEAPENGNESSYSARGNGMNEWIQTPQHTKKNITRNSVAIIYMVFRVTLRHDLKAQSLEFSRDDDITPRPLFMVLENNKGIL
jgi:hypothetical protein